MYFKELILDNYKIYYGRQSINFAIPSTNQSPYKKNLILIGGLNGAGKTTILNAIYYSLFGAQGVSKEEYKNSFTSTINDRAHEEGVRECSLELIIEDENEEITINVVWVFDSNKKLIRENRKLFILNRDTNQKEEIYISDEEYFDFINRRIPFDVAPFFIFDGEKIQDLVAKQDQKIMKDSIQKIVSLEVYKSLIEDLNKIQTSIERKLNTGKVDKQLSAYLNEIKEAQSIIDESTQKAKSIEEEIGNLAQMQTELNQEKRRKLIQNTSSNIQIEKKITEYETKLIRINKDIQSFAKEGLSNILLSSPLQKLKNRITDEKNYLDQKAQQEALQKAKFAPFESFISELLSADFKPSLSTEQKDQIENNGKRIWASINKIKTADLKEITILHDLTAKDREMILRHSFRTSENIKSLIDEKSRLEKLIEAENENLKNAPDPIDTTQDDNKLREIQSKMGELTQKKRLFIAKIRKNKELVENSRNHAKRIRDTQDENISLSKEYDYISKIKDAAADFVQEMTELKANQIRYEFKNILDKLARKDQDFDDVEFDQEEFIIRIYNDKGVEIQLKDRSAGEKQIIALSFIWALTKTAGLSLPFVIDTPLGRLDSIHRNHIIKYYFNALSDQVIILSTDTEVNKDYIDFIQDYTIRGYELVYDQVTQSSKVVEGYFSFK